MAKAIQDRFLSHHLLKIVLPSRIWIHHFKRFIHISILQFPLWPKEGLVLYSFLEGEQKSEPPPPAPQQQPHMVLDQSESGQCFSCSGITCSLTGTSWTGLRTMLQRDPPWAKAMSSLSQKKKTKKKTAGNTQHQGGGTVSGQLFSPNPQPMLCSQ